MLKHPKACFALIFLSYFEKMQKRYLHVSPHLFGLHHEDADEADNMFCTRLLFFRGFDHEKTGHKIFTQFFYLGALIMKMLIKPGTIIYTSFFLSGFDHQDAENARNT